MGVGALIPFVSGAALRGAKTLLKGGVKVAAEAGKHADDTARIVRGLSNLAEDELAQIRRWDDLLRRGQKIPAHELEAAKNILGKIGRAVPGKEISASTGRTLRELLNDAGSGFRDPDLQEAYRAFQSQLGAGAKQLEPMEWLRTTQGRHRAMVQAYLGPQAAAIEFAGSLDDYLAALRAETKTPGGMGRAWDYKRFPTLPDGVKWKVGDPIDMPNINNAYPSYDTARKRHWMNRAKGEMDARAAGVGQDLTSTDPVSRLGDPALQKMLKDGTAPPDPFHPGRKIELEHSGVPQRVVNMINDLGGDFAANKLRLAGVSDPRMLFEVTPLEHAFFDYYAHTSHIPGRAPVINPSRADISGKAWALTPTSDLRSVRPLERMSDETLLDLIKQARDAKANFNRTANTRALRDAINNEISQRGLAATPFP
jgi:hypothetical protein